MLFGRSSGFMYDLATLKHVTEILFKDNERIYRELAHLNAKSIEAQLASKGYKDLDGLSSMVAYLSILGLSPENILNYKRGLTKYLLNFREENLPYEYLAVPAADRAVRIKLSSALRVNFPTSNISISDSDWAQLSLDFYSWVRLNSCNGSYEPATNGIIGFLIQAAEFYSREIPMSIIRMLTGMGLNQEGEGRDFGAIDYHAEEMKISKDYEKFDLLASNIYNVTDFLYRHNNDIYYDMFSRYKFKKVMEHKDRVEHELSKVFKYSSVYTSLEEKDANFIVRYGKSADPEKYARPKLNERELILAELDPIVEGTAGLRSINRIIDSIMRVNADIVERTKGKDKRPVFDWSWYSSKDKLSTDNKLELLFKGVTALKQFIEYLQENGINVFTVPSAIFRDEKILRRFNSFKKYMDFLETTESLIAEEDKNNIVFVSNDTVYDDLIAHSANVINNIPLRSIKDVIDNRIQEEVKPKKEEEFVNEFDQNILGRAAQIVNMFQTATSNNLIGIYAREHTSVAAFKKFFLSNNLLSHSNGFWQVLTEYKLEDVLKLGIKDSPERVANIMMFANSMPGQKESEKYLTYLRSFDFVRVFLNYVQEVLSLIYKTPNGSPVVANSKFRVFLTINENRELFNVPRTVVNYMEFSNILDRNDFDFYLEQGKDLQDLNAHLVRWYKLMYKTFEEFMTYIKKLHDEVYMSYANGSNLEEYEFYRVSKQTLKTMGVELYSHPPIDLSPNFIRFKNLNKVDPETGFIVKGGSLYRERYQYGAFRYLHEKGYWVIIESDVAKATPVSNEDTFGG